MSFLDRNLLVRFFQVSCLLSCLSIFASTSDGAKVIFVKIYVDEEEATREAVWQRRLTKRLDQASQIIAAHTDVRFSVIGYGRWQSNDRLQDLSKTLREFEDEVKPGRARIAIGFSSQHKFQPGRNNLGGTRGPMRHHILIRENARIREQELLEVLVHELGHFLCAAHSNSSVSAMRPVVGDGQARATAFKIGFDSTNSRIMRIVGREMRDRHVDRFEQLSPAALIELRPLYAKVIKQLPKDPAAWRYLKVTDVILQQQSGGRPRASIIDPGKVLIPIQPKRSKPKRRTSNTTKDATTKSTSSSKPMDSLEEQANSPVTSPKTTNQSPSVPN